MTDHDIPGPPHNPKHRRPRSSLHRRLPDSVRDQVDEAILGRGGKMKAYQQIYDHFDLGPQFGISFSAFKRYAHKISLADRRMLQATMAAFVHSGGIDESEFHRLNTENALALLLSAAVDALLDPASAHSPQQVYHLALTIRAYHQTTVQVRADRSKTNANEQCNEALEQVGGLTGLLDPIIHHMDPARRRDVITPQTPAARNDRPPRPQTDLPAPVPE